MIGDDIILTVVEVRNGAIRLGIEAPRDLSIVKMENRSRCDVCGDVITQDNGGQSTAEAVICRPCLRKATNRSRG